MQLLDCNAEHIRKSLFSGKSLDAFMQISQRCAVQQAWRSHYCEQES